MHVTVQHESFAHVSTPLLVLGLWQGDDVPAEVASLMEADDFQGTAGQMVLLYPRGALPSRRVLLLGLGARDPATPDTLRQASARAARKAHELKVERFALALPPDPQASPMQAAQAAIEGAELGLYRYVGHHSQPRPDEARQVNEVTLVVDEAPDMAQQGAARGHAIAQGVIRARDLANGPGNMVTPAYLGEVAHEIGSRYGMQVRVLGPQQLEDEGFGGVLAVARGSAQPPRFIIMDYGQAHANQPPICLVGKGITFDTGGISLKPGADMDKMKMDMGGAAAVLGVMQALGELQLPLRVVALVSAAENMPGANAYKPGDVIGTLSGKTIEVLNTDAEGRIVLADALYYAQRYQPQAIIDIATLTGAMAIALGPHAIGVMGSHQPLIERLLRAGEHAAERAWQLPLWDEYREMVKSEVADVRNTGGTRHAGSITAAALLNAFVGDYPWAHLDIAGTTWSDSKPKSYQSSGATGAGVRLLAQTLIEWKNGSSDAA